MADFYGHFNGGGMAALDGDDFQEEDVWAVMKASRDQGSNSNYSKTRNNLSGSSPSAAWPRSAATSKGIPRSTSGGGGGHSSAAWAALNQSSAPVNVPDWPKILKKPVKRNLWDDDDNDACDDGDGGGGSHDHVKVDGDVDDEDDGDERVPPHEYLARRLARTQIASYSMCEGVGRTLKGRDLSNLRNAILTKTGFIE